MVDFRLSSRALEQLLGAWRGTGSAYAELADAVRMLCLDRRIVPGTALPAERDLAIRLGLSRTTVTSAYRALRGSGHIRSVRGSGSVVRAVSAQTPAAQTLAGDSTIDLHQASPAAWDGLSSLYVDAAADTAALVAHNGYDTLGTDALRQAIAERYCERGLPTEAGQIIVTTGAQSALSLIAQTLVRRGDRVAIETPTYPHAAEAFRAMGARFLAIAVDGESGWDLERAQHVLQRSAPTLAYLMPDFQNPTGASMNAAGRRLILEAARAAGTVLVIDETTAELDLEQSGVGRAFGAGSDPILRRQLVSVGSLSKTVWGGLRVGWIRADPDMISRFLISRPAHDLGTPLFEQAVAERAFRRMPEILEARTEHLRASRDALVDSLRRSLPTWDISVPAGGVSLWVGLGAAVSSPFALAARDHGIVLLSGPTFGAEGGHERHLRIPFTSDPERLRIAVDGLAQAWESVRERGWKRPDPLLSAV